jgi:hypothetical protein
MFRSLLIAAAVLVVAMTSCVAAARPTFPIMHRLGHGLSHGLHRLGHGLRNATHPHHVHHRR